MIRLISAITSLSPAHLIIFCWSESVVLSSFDIVQSKVVSSCQLLGLCECVYWNTWYDDILVFLSHKRQKCTAPRRCWFQFLPQHWCWHCPQTPRTRHWWLEKRHLADWNIPFPSVLESRNPLEKFVQVISDSDRVSIWFDICWELELESISTRDRELVGTVGSQRNDNWVRVQRRDVSGGRRRRDWGVYACWK